MGIEIREPQTKEKAVNRKKPPNYANIRSNRQGF